MPLPRRTVERIQAGEFVEFAEFPVLDDGSRVEQIEQELGDRVVIFHFQAPERKRNRRQVPDASLWGSCYTLYERTVLMAEPDRDPELSAYREIIQKAARSHQCEYVRNYDRQFWKAAAGDRASSWARVDSSLLMQELAGPQAALQGPGLTREAQKGKEGQELATGSTGRRASVTMGTGANVGSAVRSAEGHIPWRDVETLSRSGEGPTLEVQEQARAQRSPGNESRTRT